MQPPPFRDDPAPPSGIDPTERAQMRLQQQMLEMQLEIVRSAKNQRDTRRSRRVWLLAILAATAIVETVLLQHGFGAVESIAGAFGVLLVLAVFWTYRQKQ